MITVSTIIQTTLSDDPPVAVQWYKGEDKAFAMSAMTQAMVHDDEVDYYKTLEVKVVFDED